MFDTVVFPKDGDGYRWVSATHLSDTRVRLQGVGHVRVHQHRPVQGRVKTVSVKREGNRRHVAGRMVVPVNPRDTSRTCPGCGHVAKENRVTQDKFRCVERSFTEHADVVGATNTLRAGPALYDTV